MRKFIDEQTGALVMCLIRFDQSYENAILRAYNISEVTHMGR